MLAGVRRPKSLAAAGQCADGIILTELTGPTAVRDSLATAAPTGPFQTVVYTAVSIDDDRRAARRAIAPFIAENVAHGLNFGLSSAPFHDELVALVDRDGVDGVAAAPDEWWIELGAIGTPDDVAAHVAGARRRRGDDRVVLPAARPSASPRSTASSPTSSTTIVTTTCVCRLAA